MLSVIGIVALGANAHPTVTAHGMGDSCFNSGMKFDFILSTFIHLVTEAIWLCTPLTVWSFLCRQITQVIATETGQYAVCVPTGSNLISDTANGFIMTMNKVW